MGKTSSTNHQSSSTSSKYLLSPTQVVNSLYFNPSRLKQQGKIPVGTQLEIGGTEFLYDETMRL